MISFSDWLDHPVVCDECLEPVGVVESAIALDNLDYDCVGDPPRYVRCSRCACLACRADGEARP